MPQSSGYAEDIWKNTIAENEDLGEDILWRYFSSTSGALRIFPGVNIDIHYNPLTRPW